MLVQTVTASLIVRKARVEAGLRGGGGLKRRQKGPDIVAGRQWREGEAKEVSLGSGRDWRKVRFPERPCRPWQLASRGSQTSSKRCGTLREGGGGREKGGGALGIRDTSGRAG